ncbi:MAG: hypothetical protein IKV38_03775 [Clostridia bacterium]|nr:hypothetical protein [Clostridia bacterium]
MTKKYYLIVAFLTLLSLLVCCVLFAPNELVFGTVKQDVAVSLSNPTALATNGNDLYIADNIQESGKHFTIIHKLTTDGLQSFFTNKSLEGKTTDIAVANDGTLYLMQQNKIVRCIFGEETISFSTITVEGVFAIALTNDAIFYAYTNGNFAYVGARAINNFDKEVKAHNFYGATIRFLTQEITENKISVYFETASTLYQTKLALNQTQDGITTFEEGQEVLTDPTKIAQTIGVFDLNGQKVFFTNTTVNDILNTPDSPDLNLWQNNQILIKDAKIANGSLFVLNDYAVESIDGTTNPHYQKPRLHYANFTIDQQNKIQDFAIEGSLGASELNYAIPTINAYAIKVATAKGYPSNIIYKPTHDDFTQNEIYQDRAIQKDKFDETDKFLILNYSQDRQFCFVCYEGQFGWIKNSESLKVSQLATGHAVQGITLFNANVYNLPIENDDFLSLDSLDKLTTVSVLGEYQQFYLIAYNQTQGTTKYGFVFAVSIGANSPPKQYISYQRKAANPVVGKQLEIFATQQTDTIADNYLYDVEGKQILVKGNKEIRLYETLEDGTCYVGVVVNDILYKGYVKSYDLLKDYNVGMTNSQLLATACVAILAVIIVYIVILRVRTKKMANVREQADSLLNSKGLQTKEEDDDDQDFFDVANS